MRCTRGARQPMHKPRFVFAHSPLTFSSCSPFTGRPAGSDLQTTYTTSHLCRADYTHQMHVPTVVPGRLQVTIVFRGINYNAFSSSKAMVGTFTSLYCSEVAAIPVLSVLGITSDRVREREPPSAPSPPPPRPSLPTHRAGALVAL